MKKVLKKILGQKGISQIIALKERLETKQLIRFDLKRFKKYSFSNANNTNSFEQLQARITKEYHSLEKGFSYPEIRYGFGERVLTNLLNLLNLYNENNYSKNADCYKAALNNLYTYIRMHEEANYDVSELRQTVEKLGAESDRTGGIHIHSKEEVFEQSKADFKIFSNSRHSVRDYSSVPVDLKALEGALELAQNTPSACNRQAWKVRVINNPAQKKFIQQNQNGNRGFGDYIDKFIMITSDVQSYAKPRERKQAEIDGGMYAMNLLYALHYQNIAAVPLSASLTYKQEINLRKEFNIGDNENFIMFIGIGNYLDNYKAAKSARREMVYEYFK